MSFLVRQDPGELYLSLDGRWVERKEDARVFMDSNSAVRFCVRRSIRDICLVRVLEDGKEDGTRLYPFEKRPGGRDAAGSG